MVIEKLSRVVAIAAMSLALAAPVAQAKSGGEDATAHSTTESPRVVTSKTPEPSESPEASHSPRPEQSTSVRGSHEVELESKLEHKSGKLEAASLKVCKARETGINQRITHLSDNAVKRLGVMIAIAERTKAFAASHSVAGADYTAAVAAVESARVKAAADTAALSGKTFSCDGSDPKATATTFMDQFKQANASMKAYRTAIKHLIEVVRAGLPAGQQGAN